MMRAIGHGFFFFFFKQKTAYEIMPSLVGSEMCIRDRYQRRVHGEHHAEQGVVRGDRGGHRRVPPLQQHDRRRGGGQQTRLGLGDRAVLPYAGQVGIHQGERLLLAVLALAERADGVFVAGVGQQVEAAETLGGNDPALAQGPGGRRQGLAAVDQRRPRAVPEFQAGPADRAGIRLGMETPVQGVLVLRAAGLAHHEAPHGGVRTVVGERLDDREARAAVGAVREGVAVASIRGVEDLRQTVRAGGDVREDEGRRPAAVAVALPDLEAVVADGIEKRGLEAVNRGDRGLVTADCREEALQSFARALHLDLHALEGIDDPAFETVLEGQAVDEGPEAHALYRALDGDLQPLARPGRDRPNGPRGNGFGEHPRIISPAAPDWRPNSVTWLSIPALDWFMPVRVPFGVDGAGLGHAGEGSAGGRRTDSP
eukprot:TRINITY_DN16687_c0_g1_i1.p2 TRINITY_DN16687_c0_g1~~TRINITY_DN16687_c0_g1_i1.p2  ORF type:complete len:426 (+),score=47.11 TRINITY_DN16687_c0_g1_i1:3-1280(+)